MNAKIAGGQLEIRRFIAYTEIFLMAVVVWNAFMWVKKLSDVAMFVNGRLMAPEHDHVSAVLPLSLPLSLPIHSGYMFILAPFMHYHFLKLRYQSVRNNSVA